jgi:hypothetical protein
MVDGPDDDGEAEWEYYLVHDSIGVSHVMRTRKGAHPAVRRTNCEG